jgi:hypothetical protein
MRLRCYYCGKSVSTEVPSETVVRAVLTCPECIEKEDDKLKGLINDLRKEFQMLPMVTTKGMSDAVKRLVDLL